MESCTLLPYYFPSFTKLPLWGSLIWSTYFLIEETLWKIENNEEAMYIRLHFASFFIVTSTFYIIRCIHETSSVKKPKSSDILPQRKNFVKSVKAIWESRFTCYLKIMTSHSFLLYYCSFVIVFIFLCLFVFFGLSVVISCFTVSFF